MGNVLTISVAAYNVEDCLPRCLESFISSSVFSDLEIIVVNDGSTKDNTAALAQSYADKYPDSIKFIDKENGGHGSTINASIKAATAKYYKVVDSDDWVDREGIEKLVNFLKTTDCDLVVNPYHFIDAETMKPRSLRTPYKENIPVGKELTLAESVDDLYIEMHALTYKTEIIKKMGPVLDEKCFYVDIEYALFSLEFVKTIVCLDFPVYQYLVGMAEQSVNSANMVKRRDQHLRVFKRLAAYYEEGKDRFEPKTANIILERLKYMVQTQYKIIFRVEKKLSKQEIKEFDQLLKGYSKEIYDGPDESAMNAVRSLRKSDFKFYGLFLCAMNVRWKLKGKSDII